MCLWDVGPLKGAEMICCDAEFMFKVTGENHDQSCTGLIGVIPRTGKLN